MSIRILGIGDTANNIAVLRKFTRRSKIDLIEERNVLYPEIINKTSGVMTFKERTLDQVRELRMLRDKYDLFLVSSWQSARLAYMAGLRYIWLFNGDDIRHPLFVKSKFNNVTLLERFFYKKVFDKIAAYVAIYHDSYFDLKNYVAEPILIHALVDTNLFNPDVKPLNMPKDKFTFFSPSRIGPFKGLDVIWEAIRQCKTDFVVLQVNWLDTYPPEVAIKSKQILSSKPEQVKLIPLVKHAEMANYYAYTDAVLGQISITGGIGSTEREAAFCKKPLITYLNPNYSFEVDGKTIPVPWYPKSRNDKELAEVIDRMVCSKSFRKRIAEEGYCFVNSVNNPLKQAEKYDQLFENVLKKDYRKPSNVELNFRKMLFLLAYYSKLRRVVTKLRILLGLGPGKED